MHEPHALDIRHVGRIQLVDEAAKFVCHRRQVEARRGGDEVAAAGRRRSSRRRERASSAAAFRRIFVGEGQEALGAVLGARALQEGEVFGQRHDLHQIVAHKSVDGRVGIAHHVVADRDKRGQLLVAGNDVTQRRLRGRDLAAFRAVGGAGRRLLAGNRHGAARHRHDARPSLPHASGGTQQRDDLVHVVRRDDEAARSAVRSVQRLGHRMAFAIDLGRGLSGAIDVAAALGEHLHRGADDQRLVLLIGIVFHVAGGLGFGELTGNRQSRGRSRSLRLGEALDFGVLFGQSLFQLVEFRLIDFGLEVVLLGEGLELVVGFAAFLAQGGELHLNGGHRVSP